MLQGERVKLRPLEKADIDRAYTWINDREVTRHLTARYPMSYADEERWLNEGPANGFANGVRLAIETEDGVHIGNLDLHRGNPEDRKTGLGIMIGDKSYWSEGYGTDAIVTLLRFGFHEMNLNRVWLTVLEDNERAIVCYRRCGFREEARFRQEIYQDGQYKDIIFMGILRDEFDALHGDGASQGETDA